MDTGIVEDEYRAAAKNRREERCWILRRKESL